MMYDDIFYILIQYATLIYFDVILIVLWFFPKFRLIDTHTFLSTFYN